MEGIHVIPRLAPVHGRRTAPIGGRFPARVVFLCIGLKEAYDEPRLLDVVGAGLFHGLDKPCRGADVWRPVVGDSGSLAKRLRNGHANGQWHGDREHSVAGGGGCRGRQILAKEPKCAVIRRHRCTGFVAFRGGAGDGGRDCFGDKRLAIARGRRGGSQSATAGISFDACSEDVDVSPAA